MCIRDSALTGRGPAAKVAKLGTGTRLQRLIHQTTRSFNSVGRWLMRQRSWSLLSVIFGMMLGLTMGPAVSASAQDKPQEKPRYGGELVYVVPSEPPSYDAHAEETFGVIHPIAYTHLRAHETP